MRQTSEVTVLLLHGAGSTGATARRLLGLEGQEGIIAVEDRTGDIDRVCEALAQATRDFPDCVSMIGVSLGAHALVRWAAETGSRARLTLVLPAWTQDARDASWATTHAASQIEEVGIEGVVTAMREESPSSALVDLIARGWADYSDDGLRDCLRTAARGKGPTAQELAAVAGPARVIGWYDDPLHPVKTAIDWSRGIARARIGVAARTDISLLQSALRDLRWPTVPRPGAGA